MSRLHKRRPFVTALATTTALVALMAPLSAAAKTAPTTGPSEAGILARYKVPDFPTTPIGPKRDPK